MEKFAVGNVVLVAFPFSNLQGKKLRPALIIAHSEFDNLILCQITSRPYSSKTAIKIAEKDFSEGRLPLKSFARPDKLFTADRSIVNKEIGSLKKHMLQKILQKVRKLFSL